MLVAGRAEAPRRSRLPVIVVLVIGIALFAYAYRVDRNAGWPSVSPANQAQAERRFTAEAARIAGHPVTVALRRRLRVHGGRLRRGRCRVHPAPARVPPADDLPLAVPDRVRAPGRCP